MGPPFPPMDCQYDMHMRPVPQCPSYLDMGYTNTSSPDIIDSFSYGSSPADQCQPSNNFCESNATSLSPTSDATGMESPVPNPAQNPTQYYSEDIWALSSHKSNNFLNQVPQSSSCLSTLADMAVIMKAVHRDEQQSHQQVEGQSHLAHSLDIPAQDDPGDEEHPVRERKHACPMCHKRFDRPSTLKKHLLVHTGEKAFQCETCGRRFGVASNLNRHIRKCILKPVHAASLSSAAAKTTMTTTAADPPPPPPQIEEQDQRTVMPIRTKPKTATNSPKRRRRATTPNVWVPSSLLGFRLLPAQCHAATPVPLPPAIPSVWEERDSWDENVGEAPYHPREWMYKPRLPGPATGCLGLGGKDVGNMNYRGNGPSFGIGRLGGMHGTLIWA